MPQKPVPGRGRIDWKGPAAFVDLVKAAASLAVRPLSVYVRDALIEQMVRDGYDRAAIMDTLRDLLPPGRPRSRPKKKDP